MADSKVKSKPLLKVIREKCIDCCCGDVNEVRLCTAMGCPLHPYRMGKRPEHERKFMSKEHRDKMADLLAIARSKRKKKDATST